MKNQNRAQNRQKANKNTRVPVSGIRDILTLLGEDKGYKYRWVTDVDEKGSRIYKYKRGGWEFAPLQTKEGDIVIGEEAVYRTSQDDSIIRLQTGGGNFSYLMRINIKFYNEDQKAKQKEIDLVEESIMKTGSANKEDFGQYGSVDIKHD